MSQSDYLKHKKNANLLKSQSSLPYVLTYNQYTSFVQFSHLNNVYNNSTTFNSLPILNITNIFDNYLPDTSGCNTFACTLTHARPNRKPIFGEQTTCFPVIKPPGLSVPTYFNGSTKKKPSKDPCLCKT